MIYNIFISVQNIPLKVLYIAVCRPLLHLISCHICTEKKVKKTTTKKSSLHNYEAKLGKGGGGGLCTCSTLNIPTTSTQMALNLNPQTLNQCSCASSPVHSFATL